MTPTGAAPHLRALSTDLLVYGVSSALSRMGGLLTLPLLTRHLTMEAFGVIEMSAVLIVLLSTFLRLGVPPTLSRLFVEFKERRELAPLVTSLLAGVALAGTLVVALIVASGLLFAPVVPAPASNVETLVLLVAVIALLQAIGTVPQTVLRMERKIWRYNLLNGVAVAVYLGWVVALVTMGSVAVVNVLIGQLVGSLVALGVGLFFVRDQLCTQLEPALFVRALRFGGPLLVGRLALRVADPLSRVILLTLTGLPGVALFGVAVRISRLISLPESLFASAWQPYSMLVLRQDDQSLFGKMFSYYMGVFCSLGILLCAVSVEAVGLLATPEYSQAWWMIPGLVGAIVLGGATAFTRLGILASQRTVSVIPVHWVTAGAGVALCWLLVKWLGPVGASLSAFASAAATSWTLWSISDRFSEIRLDRRRVLLILGLFVFACSGLAALSTAITGPYSLLSRAVLAAVAVSVTLRTAFAGTPLRSLFQPVRG